MIFRQRMNRVRPSNISYYKTVYTPGTNVIVVTNIHRPWFEEEVLDDTEGEGTFTVQKQAGKNVPTDQEYELKVTITLPSGKEFTENFKMKPGEEPRMFDYVPFKAKVKVEEVTTGFKVTYTVNGDVAQEFMMEPGKDYKVVVLNEEKPKDDEDKPNRNTPGNSTTTITTTRPSTSTSSSVTSKATNAKTGDTNNAMIYIMLMLASTVGAVMLIIKRRRRNG